MKQSEQMQKDRKCKYCPKRQMTELVGNGWSHKESHTKRGKRKEVMIRAWKCFAGNPCVILVIPRVLQPLLRVPSSKSLKDKLKLVPNFQDRNQASLIALNCTQGLLSHWKQNSTWQTSRGDLILGLLWHVCFSKNISASGISHLFKTLWSIVMKPSSSTELPGCA